MFRRTVPTDELDRPLMEDGGGAASGLALDGSVPISSRTALFGTRSQQQYTPLSSSVNSTEQASDLAMQRQQANQASFEQEMTALEQTVVRDARERQARERADHELALRLSQQEEEQSAATRQQQQDASMTMLMVTVPPGLQGGQVMAVAVPGLGRNLNIVVPNGLRGGDAFHFRVPQHMMPAETGSSSALKTCAVKVPAGVRPGDTFQVILPTQRALLVVVPPGVRDGDELRIRFDETTGTAPVQQPRQPQPCRQPTAQELEDARASESLAVMESIQTALTPEQRAEREAFLAALPDDMRQEVLAQETAQKRRISAYAPPPAEPQLTPEQREFLQSLPAELRDEVERDLLSQATGAAAAPVPPPPAATAAPSAALPDLWGDNTSSLAPLQPSSSSSALPPPGVAQKPPQQQQPQLDMFQNLSVRGVGGRKAKGSEEI